MSSVPRDPFELSICEAGERVDPAADLPGLNASVAEEILAATRRVAGDHRSRCSLILGQPGIGKTHLLSRIRDQARGEARVVLVQVYQRPEACYRGILKQVVHGLRRPSADESWSALHDLVMPAIEASRKRAHELRRPSDAGHVSTRLPGLDLSAVDGVDKRAELATLASLFDLALSDLEGVPTAIPYLGDAVRACFLLFHAPSRAAALAWLSGDDLDERELETLGFHHSLDEEGRAQEALATLAYLACFSRPLLLCFDQTERLPSSPHRSGIDALGEALAYLRSLPSVSLVVSCLRDKWETDYARQLAKSYLDRITEGGSRTFVLAYPDPGEVEALLRLRLGGAIEPFAAREVRAWGEQFCPSPRELYQNASRAWRRWQEAGSTGVARLPTEAAPMGAGLEVVQSRSQLSERWARLLAQTPKPETLDAEGLAEIVAAVLGDLDLRASGRSLHELPIPRESRLALLVGGSGTRLGVVFDDTEHPRSASSLYEKLLAGLDRGECDRLVVWRPAPPPPTWKKTRESWDKLAARPEVSLEAPDPEALQRLDAFRTLLRELASEGRDEKVLARELYPEALGGIEELSRLLAEAGVGGGGAAEAAERAPVPGEDPHGGVPGPGRDLRSTLRMLVRELKVVHAARLAELAAERLGGPVEGAVLDRLVLDLVDQQLVWRLRSGKSDYVVALR